MRLLALLPPLLALAACTPPRGEPLVSAQYPPGTGLTNVASEPQPINSLPPGAGNFSTAPGATAPNYANLTLHL